MEAVNYGKSRRSTVVGVILDAMQQHQLGDQPWPLLWRMAARHPFPDDTMHVISLVMPYECWPGLAEAGPRAIKRLLGRLEDLDIEVTTLVDSHQLVRAELALLKARLSWTDTDFMTHLQLFVRDDDTRVYLTRVLNEAAAKLFPDHGNFRACANNVSATDLRQVLAAASDIISSRRSYP